jgi:hypothetical protein
MTDAELEARLLSILSPGMVIAPGLVIAAAPQNDESVPTLDAKRDAALAAPAPAIGNSTVADCVEIIPPATAPEPAPATVTVAKTQTPVPTAPQAKPLSDAARDQAYFLYTTGTVVAGASN